MLCSGSLTLIRLVMSLERCYCEHYCQCNTFRATLKYYKLGCSSVHCCSGGIIDCEPFRSAMLQSVHLAGPLVAMLQSMLHDCRACYSGNGIVVTVAILSTLCLIPKRDFVCILHVLTSTLCLLHSPFARFASICTSICITCLLQSSNKSCLLQSSNDHSNGLAF